jgi:HTH-type transcriptional regulator, competence development regulator
MCQYFIHQNDKKFYTVHLLKILTPKYTIVLGVMKMFNKDEFSLLLTKARGDRTNKGYAEESGVSRAYVSGFINKSIENPPAPDVIKRLADVAQNDITYEQLMIAAGYIKISEFQNKADVDIYNEDGKLDGDYTIYKDRNLSPKDEKDIEKRMEHMRQELMKSEGLMLSGDPVSPEAIQSIIDTLEFGMRQAKMINKKYTPKKYRKDNQDNK